MKQWKWLLLAVAVFVLGGVLLLTSGDTALPVAAVPVGSTINASGMEVILGDLNVDEKLDSSDARMVLQAAVGKLQLMSYEEKIADVDQNDVVDSSDARWILQASVKKVDEFPDRTTTTTAPTTAPTRKTTSAVTEPTVPLTQATNAVINEDPDTYCNPINVAYQYQNDYYSREGADPAAIVYRGEYYLFMSHNSGYWWSSDLAEWHFVYSDMPEIDHFAPAVCVVDDVLYLTHSVGGSIYKTTDPKSGEWEYVGKPINWDDPALFADDDGRVFCYYGLSDNAPLYVVELDPDNNMALIDGPTPCLIANMPAHGFEVPGDNNDKFGGSCYLEGAWMTKYEGKYYLQYAVPGTEYAAYANGCYVADDPMGPFTFCENGPISYKATGSMVGSGHGSLLCDLFGNWWKFDTVSISVNHMFERRVTMSPATFDEHGQLVVNTVQADYPAYVPHLSVDNYDDPRPDWQLVSYRAEATASSALDERTPDLAADEALRSWWSAASGAVGEWLQLDLGKLCAVNAVQLNFADQDAANTHGRDNTFAYNYIIEFSQDGETWYTLADHTGVTGAPKMATDTSHDYYELKQPIGVRYVRVTNKGEIPAGGKFAISELRLFGNGGDEAPAAPTGLAVDRPVSDERSATITWNAVDGAEGYIIRYGCYEDSLSIHYQVIGDTTVTIHNLNMGVGYWFTVDAYNDSGYTKGTDTVKVDWTVEAPVKDLPKPPGPSELVMEGYALYEAEEAIMGNGAVSSAAAEDMSASNSAAVHNMHMSGAYIEFANVDGGAGGSGKLRLAFSNNNASSTIEVLVNGESIGDVKLLTSGGWNIFTYVEIDLTDLKAGENNTIRIIGGREGFNPDFIQVIY